MTMMNPSEFIFDDDNPGNLYGEKYLQEHVGDPFIEVRALIESSDLDLVSDKMNHLYTTHLATYHDDPMMLGLVHVISNIKVTYEESLFCEVRSSTKTLCIPHRIAHEMRNIQDVMFFVLFERARMIVDRTQHVFVRQLGMDLQDRNHRRLLKMAVGMWGSAITRCYVASIIPERIHVNSQHPLSALLHGFDPDATYAMLRSINFEKTASLFHRLYQMRGQEPFHIELGRLPPTNEEQVTFAEALTALFEDSKDSQNDGNAEGNVGEGQSIITDEDWDPSVTNSDTDGDEENERIQGNSKDDLSKDLNTIPVPDIDVDSALGEYLNNVIAQDPRLGFGYEMTSIDSTALHSTLEKFNLSGLVEAMNNAMPIKFQASTPGTSLSLDDYSKIAQGYMPSMFEVEMEPTKKQEERYFLYIDVSYSMYVWWPVIRSMIRTMRPLIDMNNIYAFSSVVTKIDENLTQFETTNRTNINLALKHASALNQHRLVLVTDLEDSPVEAQDMDLLVLAAFPDRNFHEYLKMMRSGKQSTEDTCLRNINGKVDIHPVFLTDLMK